MKRHKKRKKSLCWYAFHKKRGTKGTVLFVPLLIIIQKVLMEKRGAQKEPSLLCPSLVMSYFTCSVRVGRRTAVVQVFVVLAGTAGSVVGTGARVTVVYPLVSGC